MDLGPRLIPPLPPGSPWAGFALPDIKHCEDNLAGWIAAPSNTWSNLAYIVVAFWLWKKLKEGDPSTLRAFIPVTVFVGLTSFLFHASFTFVFQFFDYLGMFFYVLLLLVLNLRRLGWVTGDWKPAYFAGVAASVGAILLFRRFALPVQWLIVIQAAAVLLAEGVLWFRSQGRDYGHLWAGLALMTAAEVFWLLDYRRILCDPGDHFFQAHAAWHVISALSFVSVFNFYRKKLVR
ncbi:MAG: ceramidase domain-containing protein [Elusimicrobiota bacterium]